MIDREYGQMRLVCDACENAETDLCDDFNQMIGDAKEAGWSIRSGNGEWVHKCPGCGSAKGDFE